MPCFEVTANVLDPGVMERMPVTQSRNIAVPRNTTRNHQNTRKHPYTLIVDSQTRGCTCQSPTKNQEPSIRPATQRLSLI